MGLVGLYLIFTLICTYLVQQLPRKPVNDPPDWGTVIDTTIPAVDGGFLEVWRIEPEGSSKGVVVFAHGSPGKDFCTLGFYNGYPQCSRSW
jgi:hypothetical protein